MDLILITIILVVVLFAVCIALIFGLVFGYLPTQYTKSDSTLTGIKSFFSPPTNRSGFRNEMNASGKILEIGPLDKPFDTKLFGPNYKSLDVFSKDELIRNYSKDSDVNPNKIVPPDYVINPNLKYSEQIQERFDSVISSHNIEHVPCLVTFLNNLGDLLNEKGKVYFFIPDHRYCFDHYRKASSIADVLESFYQKRSKPNFRNLLDQELHRTENDCKKWWASSTKQDYEQKHVNDFKKEQIDDLWATSQTDKYVDTHVWCFTPISFGNIVEFLYEKKYINLKINTIHLTEQGSNEFYCILEK